MIFGTHTRQFARAPLPQALAARQHSTRASLCTVLALRQSSHVLTMPRAAQETRAKLRGLSRQAASLMYELDPRPRRQELGRSLSVAHSLA